MPAQNLVKTLDTFHHKSARTLRNDSPSNVQHGSEEIIKIDASTSRDALADVGVVPSNSQRLPIGSEDIVESTSGMVPRPSEVPSAFQQPLASPPDAFAPMQADSVVAQPQPPVSTLASSPPSK